MKIRIEIDENTSEDEVIIHCRELTDEVRKIQQLVSETVKSGNRFKFYKDEKIYYLPLDNVLFFETDNGEMCAHTSKDMFMVKYKLYELEEILPSYFVRVSKSSILNTRRIYSITKNLTASSMVEFQNSHKKVYVSRYYYKVLKDMLETHMERKEDSHER